MNELLEGLEGVEVQIDDIIVYGSDVAEHDKRLANVLNRLSQANITLNKAKCEFGVKSVKIWVTLFLLRVLPQTPPKSRQ